MMSRKFAGIILFFVLHSALMADECSNLWGKKGGRHGRRDDRGGKIKFSAQNFSFFVEHFFLAGNDEFRIILFLVLLSSLVRWGFKFLVMEKRWYLKNHIGTVGFIIIVKLKLKHTKCKLIIASM